MDPFTVFLTTTKPPLAPGTQPRTIAKVGVIDLDSFYPSKDRFALAMALNNLLASEGIKVIGVGGGGGNAVEHMIRRGVQGVVIDVDGKPEYVLAWADETSINADITITQADVRALESALNMYKLDNFHFPTTEQGLRALSERPTSCSTSARSRRDSPVSVSTITSLTAAP